ncbi:Cathepsin_B [Hexamita inflata]|uniref:Cathepsin_B n=1 Tax=Hexamita inflata TaxID=28002 RepID=A0ABP1IKN4_9EUKA
MITIIYVFSQIQKEINQIIENIPGKTWKSKVYENMKNNSNIQINRILQANTYKTKFEEKYMAINTSKAPESIDWTSINRKCVDVVPDQGNCEASAQVSVLNTFSDLRCIHDQDENRVEYSYQYMLNCEQYSDNQCNEGCYTYWVWQYMFSSGAVPASCVSYKSGTTGKFGKCPTTCDDGSQLPSLVKALKLIEVCTKDVLCNIENIKKALVNGPVSTTLDLYEDCTTSLEFMNMFMVSLQVKLHASLLVMVNKMGLNIGKLKMFGVDSGEKMDISDQLLIIITQKQQMKKILHISSFKQSELICESQHLNKILILHLVKLKILQFYQKTFTIQVYYEKICEMHQILSEIYKNTNI